MEDVLKTIEQFIDWAENIEKEKAKSLVSLLKKMNQPDMAEKVENNGVPKQILVSPNFYNSAFKLFSNYCNNFKVYTHKKDFLVFSWHEPFDFCRPTLPKIIEPAEKYCKYRLSRFYF